MFSNEVAAGMMALIAGNKISAQATPTAHFVGVVNDLFDSCNGSSIHSPNGKKYKYATSENSPHLQLWTETYEEFQNSYFCTIDNSILPQMKSKKIMSQGKNGWELTIKAMMALFTELKSYGFQYMMTKRLNQDCLENYFSQIRSLGGHNTNPTSYSFHSSFKIACVNSLTNVKRNKNCLDDDDNFLVELIKAPYDEEHVITDQELNEIVMDLEEQTHGQEEAEFDIIEENVIAYLAGYVAKQILEEINCYNCRALLIDANKTLTDSTIYLYFKQYLHLDIDHGLMYPSDELLKCIMSIVNVTDEIFCSILYKDNVLKITKRFVEEKTNFSNICACADHGDILTLKIVEISSKLCLKIHLRELNRSLITNINLKSLREKIKKTAMSKQINAA